MAKCKSKTMVKKTTIAPRNTVFTEMLKATKPGAMKNKKFKTGRKSKHKVAY